MDLWSREPLVFYPCRESSLSIQNHEDIYPIILFIGMNSNKEGNVPNLLLPKEVAWFITSFSLIFCFAATLCLQDFYLEYATKILK